MYDAAAVEAAAVSIGCDRAQFTRAFDNMTMPRLMSRVQESTELMYRVGGVSFPTFALERRGHLTVIPHAQHYGHPDGFVDQIANLTTIAAGDQ